MWHRSFRSSVFDCCPHAICSSLSSRRCHHRSSESTWNFHIVPFKRETLRTRGTRTSVLILLLDSASTAAESQIRICTLMLGTLAVTGSGYCSPALSTIHLLCQLPTYSVVLLCAERLGAPPGWLAGRRLAAR